MLGRGSQPQGWNNPSALHPLKVHVPTACCANASIICKDNLNHPQAYSLLHAERMSLGGDVISYGRHYTLLGVKQARFNVVLFWSDTVSTSCYMYLEYLLFGGTLRRNV